MQADFSLNFSETLPPFQVIPTHAETPPPVFHSTQSRELLVGSGEAVMPDEEISIGFSISVPRFYVKKAWVPSCMLPSLKIGG